MSAIRLIIFFQKRANFFFMNQLILIVPSGERCWTLEAPREPRPRIASLTTASDSILRSTRRRRGSRTTPTHGTTRRSSTERFPVGRSRPSFPTRSVASFRRFRWSSRGTRWPPEPAPYLRGKSTAFTLQIFHH